MLFVLSLTCSDEAGGIGYLKIDNRQSTIQGVTDIILNQTDFFYLKRDNNPCRKEAFTLSCLGKLHPVGSSDLHRYGSYLSDLLSESEQRRAISDDVLIVGLTESGIIPSFLMHMEAVKRGIKSNWICSTRRPSSGISFKENHSHGPNHKLPISQCKPTEIWIVEDEITTGNTILNLIIQLRCYLEVKKFRVFAFADFRNKKQVAAFSCFTQSKEIDCSCHSLSLPKNNRTTEDLNKSLFLNESKDIIDFSDTTLAARICNSEWCFSDYRPALASQSGTNMAPQSWRIPEKYRNGNLLVIGEAVDLAICFVMANAGLTFQHITLSPWLIDHDIITSRMEFNREYYLYNYEGLQEPIYIINDPIDRVIEFEVKRQLKELGLTVQNFDDEDIGMTKDDMDFQIIQL